MCSYRVILVRDNILHKQYGTHTNLIEDPREDVDRGHIREPELYDT